MWLSWCMPAAFASGLTETGRQHRLSLLSNNHQITQHPQICAPASTVLFATNQTAASHAATSAGGSAACQYMAVRARCNPTMCYASARRAAAAAAAAATTSSAGPDASSASAITGNGLSRNLATADPQHHIQPSHRRPRHHGRQHTDWLSALGAWLWQWPEQLLSPTCAMDSGEGIMGDGSHAEEQDTGVCRVAGVALGLQDASPLLLVLSVYGTLLVPVVLLKGVLVYWWLGSRAAQRRASAGGEGLSASSTPMQDGQLDGVLQEEQERSEQKEGRVAVGHVSPFNSQTVAVGAGRSSISSSTRRAPDVQNGDRQQTGAHARAKEAPAGGGGGLGRPPLPPQQQQQQQKAGVRRSVTIAHMRQPPTWAVAYKCSPLGQPSHVHPNTGATNGGEVQDGGVDQPSPCNERGRLQPSAQARWALNSAAARRSHSNNEDASAMNSAGPAAGSSEPSVRLRLKSASARALRGASAGGSAPQHHQQQQALPSSVHVLTGSAPQSPTWVHKSCGGGMLGRGSVSARALRVSMDSGPRSPAEGDPGAADVGMESGAGEWRARVANVRRRSHEIIRALPNELSPLPRVDASGQGLRSLGKAEAKQERSSGEGLQRDESWAPPPYLDGGWRACRAAATALWVRGVQKAGAMAPLPPEDIESPPPDSPLAASTAAVNRMAFRHGVLLLQQQQQLGARGAAKAAVPVWHGAGAGVVAGSECLLSPPPPPSQQQRHRPERAAVDGCHVAGTGVIALVSITDIEPVARDQVREQEHCQGSGHRQQQQQRVAGVPHAVQPAAGQRTASPDWARIMGNAAPKGLPAIRVAPDVGMQGGGSSGGGSGDSLRRRQGLGRSRLGRDMLPHGSAGGAWASSTPCSPTQGGGSASPRALRTRSPRASPRSSTPQRIYMTVLRAPPAPPPTPEAY